MFSLLFPKGVTRNKVTLSLVKFDCYNSTAFGSSFVRIKKLAHLHISESPRLITDNLPRHVHKVVDINSHSQLKRNPHIFFYNNFIFVGALDTPLSTDVPTAFLLKKNFFTVVNKSKPLCKYYHACRAPSSKGSIHC